MSCLQLRFQVDINFGAEKKAWGAFPQHINRVTWELLTLLLGYSNRCKCLLSSADTSAQVWTAEELANRCQLDLLDAPLLTQSSSLVRLAGPLRTAAPALPYAATRYMEMHKGKTA